MSSRGRTPACAGSGTSCSLNSYFLGLSYTQVLSPVALAQVSAETAFLDGFQGNLYRSVPNFGYEVPPNRRERNAVGVVARVLLPGIRDRAAAPIPVLLGLLPGNVGGQLRPLEPARANDRRARLSEAESQPGGAAALPAPHPEPRRLLVRRRREPELLRDDAAAGAVPEQRPQAGPGAHRVPRGEADLGGRQPARRSRCSRWFAAGAFEISYGYYMQNDSFGNAHVLQAGYTMPY